MGTWKRSEVSALVSLAIVHSPVGMATRSRLLQPLYSTGVRA